MKGKRLLNTLDVLILTLILRLGLLCETVAQHAGVSSLAAV